MSMQHYSLLWACCLFLLAATVSLRADECAIYLDELDPVSEYQSYGTAGLGFNIVGGHLIVAGEPFDNGVGVHANSKLSLSLYGQFLRFEASVGVDDVMKSYTNSSVVFQVFVDGVQVFDSGVMRINEKAKPVCVSVENGKLLELVVTDAGDGISCDHADWGNARLITTPDLYKVARLEEKEERESKAFTVKSPVLSIDLSKAGKIVGMRSGKVERPIFGKSDLKDCVTDGEIRSQDVAGGGKAFTRIIKDENGNSARVTDRYVPTQTGIRWEMEIVGQGAPWSTSINRIFDYNAEDENVLFWTTWSDPRCGRPSAYKEDDFIERSPATILYPLGEGHSERGWGDPLVPQPLARTRLYYGLTPYDFNNPGSAVPFASNLFCIPLVTLMEPDKDFGVTLGQNPADNLFDVVLDVSRTGRTNFSYLRLRISEDSPILLRADIVPHEADWRGAMRWMKTAHPEYIEPVNPLAYEVCGTAAYGQSPGIAEICANAEKFHKMAFKVNWQASADFPFFGMYIPPTKDDHETWKAYGGWDYSVAQYCIDAKRMKEAGFYTLNYFNVFEIGTYTKWPVPPRTIENDEDLWKNTNDFIYTKLYDGILMTPKDPDACKGQRGPYDGQPIGSWEGSIIFDCAVQCVRDYLLNQAKLHLEKVPDASGICIDRLDWVRYYNLNADDGISWFHDRPTRSLLTSWHDIMEELGPLMHNANKVIYVNNHSKRIDALKHVDGIYDEFTYAGAPLNLTALLCVSKPALAWTDGAGNLQPDPDAYFQKYLYLGLLPSAPVPHNDHCIGPDPIAEKHYTEYGQIMLLLRGRKWVLEPYCISATNGAAKVNLFEIPDGYLAPVCYAGDATEVEVVVKNINGINTLKAVAYHPAEEESVAVPARRVDGILTLKVPVKRGFAMVKLTP